MSQQQYDNTNTGIISKNDRKTTDKHPDINGTLDVEGVEYWISGWKKTRKSDGGTFYSLSVKRKDGQAPASRQQSQPAEQPPPRTNADDVPFAWIGFLLSLAASGAAMWLT